MEERSHSREYIQEHILFPQATVRETIETIEKTGSEIALICDGGKLGGIVTDSDVRRGILRGVTLDDPVERIWNRSFHYASHEESWENVMNRMKSRHIRQMPVLDEQGMVVDLLLLRDMTQPPHARTTPVLIMAGGPGTRLRPLTESVPKPMVPVGGKPILQILMERLRQDGFREIIMSVHYRKEMIQSYFGNGDEYGLNIRYVEEPERLGTAGAVRLARKMLKEPFLVVNGDIMTRLNFHRFLKFHLRQQAMLTIATAPYEMIVPYGVVETSGDKVLSVTEKPRYRLLVNAGLYCMDPEAIRHIPSGQYYDMTQLIIAVSARNALISHFPIHEYWLDIGRIPDYEKANDDYLHVFRHPSDGR